MVWRVRAIRGATTASENSVKAIREAVNELLDELEARNQFDPDEVVSVTFSVTRDLDTIFPATIARERPHWQNIPLLDVQQMHVDGDLKHCVRCLIHFNTPDPDIEIYHPYLRQAEALRPDRSHPTLSSEQQFSSTRTQKIFSYVLLYFCRLNQPQARGQTSALNSHSLYKNKSLLN